MEGIGFNFYQETHRRPVGRYRLRGIGKRLCKTNSLGGPSIEPKIRDERCPPLMLTQKDFFLALREEKGDSHI